MKSLSQSSAVKTATASVSDCPSTPTTAHVAVMFEEQKKESSPAALFTICFHLTFPPGVDLCSKRAKASLATHHFAVAPKPKAHSTKGKPPREKKTARTKLKPALLMGSFTFLRRLSVHVGPVLKFQLLIIDDG